MTMKERAYPEQVSGPVDDALCCGSASGESTSIGAGKGASLSESLESLVDGLNAMAPVEMGRLIGVSDGVLHTVQDDLVNTSGEH